MHLKKEFSWKVFAFRIFESLRNYPLMLICGFFLLAASANTASAETTTIQQQTISISGVITDTSGELLIGASVLEKGTLNGTATNVDGAFTLIVAPNATIEVTYLGFLPTSFKVETGKTVYNVQMKEDSKSLEEVVVIGYGVQKKKLVAGATINVTGENIQRMSTSNAFTALQSQTPGVNILQRNGQPGSGYIVNIRGIATNGEARPLYVVDGMAAGRDALNELSPSDIESIDILKDAASSAIYGARAANGVVLVTTKQGKSGKPRISYDGTYGAQYMAKKPDMLNAKEYIMVQNEKQFNMTGESQWVDWENLLPKGMYSDVMSGKWKGSDWVDAFYNKGAINQSHAINLTGGGDYSKFSMGYSYYDEDGILGHGPAQSHQARHTVRLNSDHVILKGNGFDILKVGQTLNYVYTQRNGIPNDGMYWNAFTQLLRANPLMPIFNKEGGYYDGYDKLADGWKLDANQGNPVGAAAMSEMGLNLNKSHRMRVGAFMEIQPIKNLIFRSLFGYNMSAYNWRGFDEIAYWHDGNGGKRDMEHVSQSAGMGYNWSLDNTLTYNISKNDHHITAQVGQTLEKGGYGQDVNASSSFSNFSGLGWDYAWVNNYVPKLLGDVGYGGSPWGQSSIASFFGRAMYNFQEKYMLTALLRADGSSNFARGKRWGYFPAIQAGWIISNENFMEGLRGTLDFLKLTANWAQVGNQDISNFTYMTQFRFSGMPLTYYFGDGSKQTPYAGAAVRRLPNPDVTWENQQMLDLGLQARMFNNRLGIDFNYFNSTTKDWLLEMPISATWGFGDPMVNSGAVKRSGYELSFNWNDRVNDFNYGINLNGAYNQSEVTEIRNPEGVLHGGSNVLSQTTTEFYRLQVGKRMGFFYGYKSDGIFQNWNDVNAYQEQMKKRQVANGVDPERAYLEKLQPGDVIFRDIDGNGLIDEDDKTDIGCGWPSFRAGFTFNASYKGFDFMVVATGAFGFDIAKSYRSFADSETQNYTTQVFERWTGEGTSNKWPRLTVGNNYNYQRVSDIFLEKGDYVKIQNITFGYDFKKLFPKMPVGKARIFLTGQNLFTFTGYSGMDPEVGWGDGKSWMSGIDVGMYPASKSFLCGVNLTF